LNKKISVETEFIYHNVGQGLFYSGNMTFNSTFFRFVYDCGSENIQLINASVRRFKHDINDNKIDLLIIPHLHSDHINGLDELFDNFTIKEVILPYFSPIERLLIALRRMNVSTWYYYFLADPVKYLFEKGVKRVIVLGGEEGSKEEILPEEVSPSSQRETQDKLNIRKLPDDEKLKEKIVQYDKKWKRYIENNQLLVKKHNGYIIALGLWLFRFFNYKITSSVLQNFKDCIGRMGLNIEDSEHIKNVIKNKMHLKDLKSCYTIVAKHLRKDFNNTSLTLFHSPIGRPHISDVILCCCPCCFYGPCGYYHRRIFLEKKDSIYGHFLMGDIDLNTRYNELMKHYSSCLKNIFIAQVPHHGAKKNWNRKIIENIPNSDFWIISAGFRNRYGHPSYKVIEDICLNGKKCFWVNEITHIATKGKVKW